MQTPLSEQLRPESLEEISGQRHLTDSDGLLSRILKNQKPLSILLWGPPGCGKTTIAKLYAKSFDARFICFSSVFESISDLKKIIKESRDHPLFQKRLIIFIDEIHRLNKAQQDTFLPLLEDGSIVLVCATTENPSFVLNNALLSRLRVLPVHPLDPSALGEILDRCEKKTKHLNFSSDAKKALISFAQGDARHLLNMLENILEFACSSVIDLKTLEQLVQKKSPLYDKDQDGHYQCISALHKSVRGSDPDAAMYWLTRMLDAGEDPRFLTRRMIRMAVEDIGLADPQALIVATHAWQAYSHLGSPEGELALAQAIVYLALAPKSNAIYSAFREAKKLSSLTSHLEPPKIIINAPTKWMHQMGYAQGYAYDHDEDLSFSGQNYFPDALERQEFYRPVERGYERELRKRLEYFSKLRNAKNAPGEER